MYIFVVFCLHVTKSKQILNIFKLMRCLGAFSEHYVFAAAQREPGARTFPGTRVDYDAYGLHTVSECTAVKMDRLDSLKRTTQRQRKHQLAAPVQPTSREQLVLLTDNQGRLLRIWRLHLALYVLCEVKEPAFDHCPWPHLLKAVVAALIAIISLG